MSENRNFVYSGSIKNATTSRIVTSQSQLQQELQDLPVGNAIKPCQGCGGIRTNLVKMPDYSVHYAARRCGQCDLFRGWESSPATKEKLQQRQATISLLLKSPQLSQWERRFLDGLKESKISPKQQEVLIRIETKVGGLA